METVYIDQYQNVLKRHQECSPTPWHDAKRKVFLLCFNCWLPTPSKLCKSKLELLQPQVRKPMPAISMKLKVSMGGSRGTYHKNSTAQNNIWRSLRRSCYGIKTSWAKACRIQNWRVFIVAIPSKTDGRKRFRINPSQLPSSAQPLGTVVLDIDMTGMQLNVEGQERSLSLIKKWLRARRLRLISKPRPMLQQATCPYSAKYFKHIITIRRLSIHFSSILGRRSKEEKHQSRPHVWDRNDCNANPSVWTRSYNWSDTYRHLKSAQYSNAFHNIHIEKSQACIPCLQKNICAHPPEIKTV